MLMSDVAHGRVKVRRISPGVAQVKALLDESNVHLTLLSELSKNRNVPRPYAESIAEDAAILQDIRKHGIIGQPQYEQIKAVNADLRIKADHAEMAPEAAFDTIEIVVHTRKNGQELGNYQIWYVKEAYRNDASKYQTFDRFSSPASRKMPPGKYLMWAQATDGSKAMGEKTPKEFGDGQAKVETDLGAP